MPRPPKIIYTHTDEAPALASYSLLPIVEAFTEGSGVELASRDISLGGRILAAFAGVLRPDQQVADALAELGALARTPAANIVKLPNISASVPQLKAAIAELQAGGFNLPEYPDEPGNEEQVQVKARYDRVKGSAVNPVLREGNSDRRAPKAVKAYARAHPHTMGPWSSDSRTHVASMDADDFRGNERSLTLTQATEVTIEHVGTDSKRSVMAGPLALEAGEIIDATFMSRRALIGFLEDQIEDAREQGVLFSLHLKATMMKVSDPIIFGHAVRTFFADLWDRHGETLDRIGADERNGLGDVLGKVASLPADQRSAIEDDLASVYRQRPGLAMVNSDLGITNLHVPSDVIVDASMPAMIRESGRMWNSAGETQDTKAVIPDRCYAGVYQAVIDFCKEHGAFDPTTMGSVSNVGLMALKAEEYGSHDKTFEAPDAGSMRVVDSSGAVLMEHEVERGDIWRMCQVKDAAIRDWVKLAVSRARATGSPAVFWLDADRPHDAELIVKVQTYLAAHDTAGLDLLILSPIRAALYSLDAVHAGRDVISVTGNVLRDYLTDLFPILEVGTSARMLSIVPLMNGGGLFETGAGGSAPKHVQQFERENHLRWDSLGEFLALAASMEHLAQTHGVPTAGVLGRALEEASEQYLLANRAPSRRCGELDSRGSHFYLALYWARALARQTEDPELAARFSPIAGELEAAEEVIVRELLEIQGVPVNLGGYYRPDPAQAAAAMRPSATFNAILAGAAAAPV